MAFQFPNPLVTPEFTGANGVTYQWDTTDEKWVIKGYQIDADNRYVNKIGGDEMEGPLKVTVNPDIQGSRDSRKIETYGVFSGTDTTALRLGTNRDRVYIGDSDTSFNGLVKIDELSEKNANNGIKVQSPVKMNQNQIKNLAEATNDKDAVTYKQVKDELTALRDEFIQDLIVGTWGVDNVQSLISPGTNRMCLVKSNGQAATKFSEAAIIRFFYKDDQGSDVLWDNWDPGEIVSFRQLNDPSVTASFRLLTAASTNGNVRSFSVSFIKSENDVDPFGTYMQRYAVTLTEFSSPVDPDVPLAELEHSPYIANMSGNKSGVDSSDPNANQVAGFYTSGSSNSVNPYPGNFNSFLKCGKSIVSTQKGTNNYEELPDGHDEAWVGTVSVINLDTGGLLYKNTLTRVSRSGDYVTLWVRDRDDSTPKKPMFAYGHIDDWTNISVLVEGYRVN